MNLKINILPKTACMFFLGIAIFANAQTAQNVKQDRKLFNKNYGKIEKTLSKKEKEERRESAEKESEGIEKEKETPEEFIALDYIKTMDVQTGKQHTQTLIKEDKAIKSGKYDPSANNRMKMFSPNANATGKIDITNQWVERGPYKVGGRTRAIMFDPNDATGKKVWAGGISGGLWYNNDITDANSEWKQVSDLWANMTVSCITFDPNNNQIFYVGTGESYTNQAIGSGLWKTTDGGTTWTQIFKKALTYSGGNPPATPNTQVDANFFVNDIKVRNNQGVSEVYVALGNGTDSFASVYNFLGINETGLYKSTDAGTTFSLVNIAAGQIVSPNSIFIAKDNSIYVGTTKTVYSNQTQGGKIFKSTNGTAFTQVYTVGNQNSRVQVTGSNTNGQIVYALMQGTGNQNTASTSNSDVIRFLKSTNGGITWQTTFGPNATLTVPKNYEKGETVPFDFTRKQSFYDLVLAVDPSNDQIVYVGGIDYHKSINGGQTWTPITRWRSDADGYTNLPNETNLPVVHSDHHAVVFNYKNSASTQMIFGGDGGVFYVPNRSAASSLTWATVRNNRYNVTQYYHGQLNPTSTSTNEEILGGTQDNGTQQFLGAPTAQGTLSNSYLDTEYSGGDGGYVGFDDQNLYKTSSYTNNNIYLTNGTLTNGNIFKGADQATGHFINEYAIDRKLDILYTYKGDNPNISLFRVKNLKTAVVDPSNTRNEVLQSSIVKDELNLGAASNGETLSTIVVSPYTTTSTTLFVGTTKNKLIKVTNADKTPVVTTIINPFVGNISDIEFGANQNQMLVTVSNYNTVSVFYTADGGATWDSKEGNLIDVPVRCAFINPDDPKEVLLGTELGIFGTTNFNSLSPTWAVYNMGMPNVRITNLDYRPSDKTILATTFGRGIFTTVNAGATLATSENVKANNQNVIFPNPSVGGAFTIKTDDTKPLVVTVFDTTGRMVYKINNVTSGKLINSNLSSGVYLVKVNNGTKDILDTKLIVK